MTLDCKLSTASAIKGHFCSLLISNILCYPRFRNLPFASLHIQLHTTSFSLVRIPLCIRAIAKGEFAGVFLIRQKLVLCRLNFSISCLLITIYMMRTTAVFFFLFTQIGRLHPCFWDPSLLCHWTFPPLHL